MKKVARADLLSNPDYEAQREEIRTAVLAVKGPRRIHLGEHLTFLFETTETMRYQVQEMLRIEQRDGESEIAHEIATYNEVLGDEGELGCTLLIEIDDPLQRDLVLRRWLDLPRHLYLRLADGSKAHASFDERQVGDDRLSSVQYLKFTCGQQPPVAIGIDKPDMDLEVDLTDAQRAALAEDLR